MNVTYKDGVWIGFDPNDLQTEVNKQADEAYIKGTTEFKPTACPHEFVLYTGLNEQFEYCKKCDVNR